MSDSSQGDGWWIASDGKWYSPELHPDYVAPAADAAPGAAPTAPWVDPPAGETQVYQPDPRNEPLYGEPSYNIPDAGQPSSRTDRRRLFIGAGVLIVVVVVGFLLFRLLGGGGGGGASSPEGAVNQLIDSINDRDAVGFVEILDPDELEAWVGSFSPAIDRINESLETGDTQDELADLYQQLFDAIDISITGADGEPVEFEVTELDPDGRVARVRIASLDISVDTPDPEEGSLILASGGDVTAADFRAIDGARVELRDDRFGVSSTAFLPDGTIEEEFTEDIHIDLVAVEKSGDWYLSTGYTILELARLQPDGFPGPAQPDFGAAYRLVDSKEGGSDSGEQVVRDFVAALEVLDYDEMIRLTDPLGLPYLHDYQPYIDQEVDPRELRDNARELDLRFDDIELGESEWADRTLVTLGEIAGRIADGSFEFNARTWCVEATSPDGDQSGGCLEDAIAEALESVDDFETDPRDFIPEEIGIVVVERNGRWYLDPLGTMGFYLDQVAATSLEFFEEEIQTNSFGPAGTFILIEGPIARQGEPATHQAVAGSAGVAMELDAFEAIEDSFSTKHVALARVTSTASGNFVSFDEIPLRTEQWIVAFDEVDDSDDTFPAILAATDGELTVELFDLEFVSVGEDGFDGAIDDEGRPQVFVFDESIRDVDIEINGANYEVVSRFEGDGTVLGDTQFSSFGSPENGQFTVVFGEPRQQFSITPEIFIAPPPPPPPEPEPTPEPVPPPPPPGLRPVVVDDFEEWVAQLGFEFAFESEGGYFDGCGPDNPEVTTYAFEDPQFELALITPYESSEIAESAFNDLLTLESPCEAFPGLIVVDVNLVLPDEVRVTYNFDDDESLRFEQYILRDDVVIVGFADSEAAIEDLMAWLRAF